MWYIIDINTSQEAQELAKSENYKWLNFDRANP